MFSSTTREIIIGTSTTGTPKYKRADPPFNPMWKQC